MSFLRFVNPLEYQIENSILIVWIYIENSSNEKYYMSMSPNFSIDMYLIHSFVCTSSEAFKKVAHIRRFVWAIAVGLYDKYKLLMIKPR